MHRKIKIFLGGYVNYLNAQNINCRALSEHLDKEKFKITTMLFPVGNAYDFTPIPRVRYYRLYRPASLWKYITYLRGIAFNDIAYLPKGEIDGFCRNVAKLFGTKIFTTVEGMIDGSTEHDIKNSSKKHISYVNHYRKYEPNLFAITRFLAEDLNRRRQYVFSKETLYLGVDSNKFFNPQKKDRELHDIVFIGNSPAIKNIGAFFEAARRIPEITFHIVGGNQLQNGTVEDYISSHGLHNVIYHGRLDHTQLSELLSTIDLMYFPSRSEGFPKVHLETACAGVPTLCYNDYGAEEWITSWKNGIIVNSSEEAVDAIRKLQSDRQLLSELSANAVELGRSFDWSRMVVQWEKVIERLYNS